MIVDTKWRSQMAGQGERAGCFFENRFKNVTIRLKEKFHLMSDCTRANGHGLHNETAG